MNKKESFGALAVIIGLVVIFCISVVISVVIAIHYWDVAIGEIPLGSLIALIAYTGTWLKLLNIGFSILKEIKDL